MKPHPALLAVGGLMRAQILLWKLHATRVTKGLVLLCEGSQLCVPAWER